MKDGLYNYFSSHNTQLFRVLISIFFIVLTILIFLFSDKIFDDQNLYYYVLSTVVQGFLALVGFLGAVVIYKLQIIETDLNKISEAVIPYLKYFVGAKSKSFSWAESINESDRIAKEKKRVSGNKFNIEQIEIYSERLKKLSAEKGEIRSIMVDFSLLSFLNIGFSLIAIPVSKIFVENEMYFSGGIVILISILLSCISMVFGLRVIRKTLGYSFYIQCGGKIKKKSFEIIGLLILSCIIFMIFSIFYNETMRFIINFVIMMTQQEFIVHACEQALRFTSVEKWDDLSEELKVQLGFNMGVLALGLGLTKEDGFLAFSNVRQGNMSMHTFREHVKDIISLHEIKVDEAQISRPF